MDLVVYDRVQQTGTANTTVSFTLSATTTGYQSFAAVGNGNTTYYAATDGTNWEVGLGTYSTTGPTLTRTTILSSSNSGSAVTFSGTVTVWVDYPAGKAVYQDSTGNVSVSNLTDSALTSSRVTYAGTSGLLQDSANMTFSGTALTLANDLSVNGYSLGKGGGNVSGNVVFGSAALATNSSSGRNTAIGNQALRYTTVGDNTAVGYFASLNNTTGTANCSYGYSSLSNNTTGSYNSAYGQGTLQQNTTASNLVAVGQVALQNNTTNVASIGAITGGSSYTNGTYTAVATTPSSGATFNTYPTVTVTVLGGIVTAVTLVTSGVGASVSTATSLTVAAALIGGTGTAFSFVVNLQSGTGNTATGYASGQNATVATNNTYNGYNAGNAVTTGSNNVFLGQGSGFTTTNTTTGFQLVYIGSGSRGSAATNQNEIAIGYNATGLGTNTTVIGNSSTTLTKAFGVIVGTNYTVATLPSASTSGVGARAFVTDALAPVFGSTVVTGGAVATPVYSDGSAWKVG